MRTGVIEGSHLQLRTGVIDGYTCYCSEDNWITTCVFFYTGGGRIILSDGGGIRRNVIVVQKPSSASALTTTAVAPFSSVRPVSTVTPATVDVPVSIVTPVSNVIPMTVDIPASNTVSSLPEVSCALDQVRHFCTHAIQVHTPVKWLLIIAQVLCLSSEVTGAWLSTFSFPPIPIPNCVTYFQSHIVPTELFPFLYSANDWTIRKSVSLQVMS